MNTFQEEQHWGAMKLVVSSMIFNSPSNNGRRNEGKQNKTLYKGNGKDHRRDKGAEV